MMRLSQYVPDPLASSSDLWCHPITQAKVRLSPTLRARLPGILRANLHEEAHNAEETLNQLIAFELRDLGFLVPNCWEQSEEKFFALHRSLCQSVPGFFGRNPTPTKADGSLAQLMTVGAEDPQGSQSPLLALRQKSHQMFQGKKNFVDLKGPRLLSKDFLGDLGHLDTRDLTPEEMVTKIKQGLPRADGETARPRIPIILMDEPSSLPYFIHDPHLWSHHKTVLVDHTLRFGPAVPKAAERLRPVSSQNLFAHLEWSKRDEKFTYLLPSSMLGTSAPEDTVQEILNNNLWKVLDPSLMASDLWAPQTNQTEILWVLHGDLFSHQKTLPLGSHLVPMLNGLIKRSSPRGLVIWGLHEIPAAHLDLHALHETLWTVVRGVL